MILPWNGHPRWADFGFWQTHWPFWRRGSPPLRGWSSWSEWRTTRWWNPAENDQVKFIRFRSKKSPPPPWRPTGGPWFGTYSSFQKKSIRFWRRHTLRFHTCSLRWWYDPEFPADEGKGGAWEQFGSTSSIVAVRVRIVRTSTGCRLRSHSGGWPSAGWSHRKPHSSNFCTWRYS